MAKLWSENEINFLKENYLNLSDSEIGSKIGRSSNSVERKRSALGLIKNTKPTAIEESIINEILNSNMGISDASKYFGSKYNLTYNQIRYLYNSNGIKLRDNTWSDEEISYLKLNCHKSAREIAKHLKRTEGSVAKKSRAIGVSLARTKPNRNDSWSEKEIKFLKENYHKLPINEISRHLNRTEKAVQVKATKMYLYARSRMWSNIEDDILVANKHLTLSELSFILERTEKSIKHRAKELDVRIGNRVRSKVEAVVEEIIKSHGIEYIKDARPLREVGYEADFLFSNVIIEVQGDYWHCNPNIFKHPSDKQEAFIAKDRLKKTLFESAGYKVYYIWEDDVNNCINQVEEQIALIIRNNSTRGSKPIFGGICDKRMLTAEALKC